MAEGISEWMPVIQTLSGAVLAGTVAIGVSWLNHRFARDREENMMADRRRQERELKQEKYEQELLFIATELVFLLEEFAEGSASAATDSGCEDNEGILRVTVERPDINFSQVSGDWRVLPPKLMYRIRELPILLNEADKYVESAWDNDWPPDFSRTFEERQYQYSRAGLKALFSAIRLRKLAGLPPTRLAATEWSAQPVLRKAWKEECRRRLRARMQVPVFPGMINSQLQSPPGDLT